MILEDITVKDKIEAAKDEARDERTEEIAKNMKNDGKPYNEITKYTGLPIETIENRLLIP
jgi:hypothetical protein